LPGLSKLLKIEKLYEKSVLVRSIIFSGSVTVDSSQIVSLATACGFQNGEMFGIRIGHAY